RRALGPRVRARVRAARTWATPGRDRGSAPVHAPRDEPFGRERAPGPARAARVPRAELAQRCGPRREPAGGPGQRQHGPGAHRAVVVTGNPDRFRPRRPMECPMNCFVRPRPLVNPSLRVIAFHHAGGSAAMYCPMSTELPADWEL